MDTAAAIVNGQRLDTGVGMATGLASVLGGTAATLVDCVQYDAAGRLVRLRYMGRDGCGGGGGVYGKHYYYGWLSGSSGSLSVGDGNGRYRGMAVGTQPGTPAGDLNVAGTEYHYDSFGNVGQHKVGGVNATLAQSGTFSYDEQNRITSGYGQGFSWRANGNFTSFNGAIYGYNPITQTHAVDTVNGVDLFDYNRDGSMSVRNKGTTGQQRFYWDSRNQLQQVVWGSPQVSEVYGYDENGRRIAKAQVQGGTTTLTFYPFDFYEQRGSSGSGVTKYYFFAGERFAMRTGTGVGGGLYLLFKDRISSTVHVTDANGNTQGSTGYYAFGATHYISGTIPTDHRFTDQQLDGTGLYYYGARYYDPNIGQFLSPDTLVPDPTNVMDYQRYAYARGNPLKYNDPTGHYSIDELKQHFGVNSFDELMLLFEEGGAYAGLEGWYDVLRFAQDGDTIIATNEVAGFSLTGTFVRSAQGKIQIDRGEWGIAPESVFAQFGGIITQGKVGEEHIIGIDTYELRGQEYAWRAAVTGGQRYIDMRSCYNIDCIAVAIDGVGVAGAGLQMGSAVCGPYAGACYNGGRAISGIATVVGWGYTAISAWQGNATGADLAATTVTAATGLATEDPKVSLGAGVAQFIWDTFVSPLQR